jgi:hypothetical protein
VLILANTEALQLTGFSIGFMTERVVIQTAGPGSAATMKTTKRWIAHQASGSPPWENAVRRELVAAFRRGTMDAERCLGTYRLQGSREILPPEAVVYLAAQVVAERATCFHESLTADALSDHGGRELAVLFELDREGFEDLIEAGRRFFFPGR